MIQRTLRVLVGGSMLAGLTVGAGCGDADEAAEATSGGTTTNTSDGATTTTGASMGAGGDGAGAAGTGTGMGGGATTGTGSGAGGATPALLGCHDPRPANAPMPPALPTYGGTCPTLQPGLNQITSDGKAREFRLVVPQSIAAGESLPVVFLWHWLGGDATDFIEQGEVQEAADAYRFIAVVPEKKGDVQFTWPMDALSNSSRRAEEATFFDDMLACVAAQYDVNADCVSSAGVSAGALFTSSVLAGERGQHLSSIVSLSGGTGGLAIQPWSSPAHKMPAIVLWGGPTDSCLNLLSFETLSQDLETGLANDGHFFLECVHNCGHAEPPFDAPPGEARFAMMWQFIMDHPYWLADGDSPYLSEGLPAVMPAWCGIGAGSATPRTGQCLEPGGC
ncbi:MAG: PHB depolymerase family esterase [Myxococcota bacterium]